MICALAAQSLVLCASWGRGVCPPAALSWRGPHTVEGASCVLHITVFAARARESNGQEANALPA